MHYVVFSYLSTIFNVELKISKQCANVIVKYIKCLNVSNVGREKNKVGILPNLTFLGGLKDQNSIEIP